LPHNGVDIDQYILLTIYPIVVFFAIAILGKKFKLDEALKYFFQGISCILFAVFYIILIPRGGAQGLAIILILFGILLFFMARKQKISPKDQTQ
jgi:O-antigen/teichoic acid export membrane protein